MFDDYDPEFAAKHFQFGYFRFLIIKCYDENYKEYHVFLLYKLHVILRKEFGLFTFQDFRSC